MLPEHLTIIRHGESEHNVANRLSHTGDHSLFTKEFRERLPQHHRLTPRGIPQAIDVGDFLRKSEYSVFDSYYVSPHIRAIETAYYLNLPEAHWRIHRLLREREAPTLKGKPIDERERDYPGEEKRSQQDPMYWRPPQGESMADVELRLRLFFADLQMRGHDGRLILVTHSRVIWTLRVMFEHLKDAEIGGQSESPSTKSRIGNGTILQYERRETSPLYSHKRLITLGHPASEAPWEEINEPIFRNEDLYDLTEEHGRLLASAVKSE